MTMNNQFNNRIYDISVIQNISYVVVASDKRTIKSDQGKCTYPLRLWPEVFGRICVRY